MPIEVFIKTLDYKYDNFGKQKDYKGFKVWRLESSKDKDACVGYPTYALEKDGELRLAKIEEVLNIMDMNLPIDDNE